MIERSTRGIRGEIANLLTPVGFRLRFEQCHADIYSPEKRSSGPWLKRHDD